MKNYLSLVISRTAVSQVIMPVRKPKVEYKLALHERPKGAPILGDPGADKGGQGKSKRAEKY